MKKFYLFFCLLLVGVLAKATTYSWSATNGNWNTGANWTNTTTLTTGTVPGASDDVLFANTSTATVTLDFTTSTSVRSITIGSSANVIFTSGATRTINLGAVASCLVIPSGRALTLTGTANGSQGVVLSIPTGGSCTISGTLNLASFSNSITTQTNQLLAVDANSVTVASGASINYNNNNSSTPFGAIPTNTSNTNVIVFQSGSTFTAYSAGNAWGNTSGAGIPQFLQGSKFNLFGGSAMGAAANFANGRTYAIFVMGNGGTGGAQTNTTGTTTTFLDSLVVSSGTLTLTNDGVGTANPTFSIANIRLSTGASATPSSLALRTNTAQNGVDATFNISGGIAIIAASNAVAAASPVQLTLGPSGVGTSTSTSATNIKFTGNCSITLTKQAGALNYPNLAIGVPTGLSTTGVMPTKISIENGASLALGDSLTLRTGTQSYTSLTIKPTGRLTITDNAELTTQNNGYAIIESDATGTGSIGTVVGKLTNSFIVKRYIPANAAWRTLGLPFNTVTYVGTSTGTSQVDLNYFASKSPTWAYYYNEAADDGKYGTTGGVNAGWTAITAATTGLSMRRGLLLYGSRNQTAYTLTDTGFINYGTQTIALSKTVNGWNLVANPYASNITWNTIQAANTGVLASSTVYRVNPLGGGAYSFSSFVSGSGSGTNGGSNVIENGAAFFVQASTAGNLTISESDKTTSAVSSTSGGVSLMGANDNYNSIRLKLKGANTFTDEVAFVWGRFSKATEGFDADLDAYDLGASGTHDLSIIGSDNTSYSIFNGADLSKTAETRTYKLGTKNLKIGAYEFSTAMPKELDRNNEAYIVDNYLKTATLVKDALVYKFDVSADAASKAEDRFQLDIRKKIIAAPVDAVAVSGKTYLLGNPSSNNKITVRFGQDAQTAKWQLVDLSGRLLTSGALSNVYEGDTRVIETQALKAGTYLVKIFNDNEQAVVLKWIKY